MIVYDIETIRPVRPHDESETLPGIEYADSWTDYTGMGIACICCYDYEADRFRVFGGTDQLAKQVPHGMFDLDRFAAFAANRIVIGWNNRRFDDPLLAAHGIDVVDSWDIKAALMHAGCGGQRGNSLEAFAQANLSGTGKSMTGAMAPIWWQRGLREHVIDYCLQDVNLTRRLLDRLIHKGELTSPLTGKPIRPDMPAALTGRLPGQPTAAATQWPPTGTNPCAA